jgi:hypothetical protein
MSANAQILPMKDPNAVKPYGVDWEGFLDTGDTISSVSWTVPSGITKDSESNTNTVASLVLSGGTAGVDYEIVCQITTANGIVEEQSIVVPVRDR